MKEPWLYCGLSWIPMEEGDWAGERHQWQSSHRDRAGEAGAQQQSLLRATEIKVDKCISSTHSRYSPRGCWVNVMAEWRSENVRWMERAPPKKMSVPLSRKGRWTDLERKRETTGIWTWKTVLSQESKRWQPLPKVSKKKISCQNVG